jgi:hypothetical protein
VSAFTLIIGIGNLVIGTAYAGLGLLSLWEAATQYRYRGLSRFGLGFTLMAASCGPHHLVHGWCVLQGGAVSTPMLMVTLIGLPAGAIFVGLRLEAMLGGRGDRTILASPNAPVLIIVAFAVAAGALASQSLAMPPLPAAMCTLFGLEPAADARPGAAFGSLIFLTNIAAATAYVMVGWYLFVTQVRRYAQLRQWSLSGLSLAAVFPTCAFMHVIHALSFGSHSATLAFDLLGVPASIYFLWVVKRVHRDSVVDWNRRPLVGMAATPDRSSPWSVAPQ